MLKKIKTGKSFIAGLFEDLVNIGVIFVISISVVIMLIAGLDKNIRGEAPVGSFTTYSVNSEWILETGIGTQTVDLPYSFDTDITGNKVTIKRMLPSDLSNGMNMIIRSTMEDVSVYIDGVLRSEYTSANLNRNNYYIPSAYIVTGLDAADSGREIKIVITAKRKGIINTVTVGYGEDAWYNVILQNGPVIVTAVVVLILGLLLIASIIFSKTFKKSGSALYLGLLMFDVALWMITESQIRQLIFRRPSLSIIFSFLTVEIIAVLGCMFFDEVQHRRYHRYYLVDESIGLMILLVNSALDFTGVLEYFETLTLSHIWSGICAVQLVVFIILDITSGRIKKYFYTAIGMIGFLVLALTELILFYISSNRVFGSCLCIGLIILMFTTVIQIINDIVGEFENKEKDQARMTINTIETIAGAIDARDEYTGGHSERVGFYAERLAREMAADYDLTEEDILRVHYIGLVHDIGKIGVADSVLNKSGRLNDEEFALMKKHSEIGYEIMSSMGDTIEGMLDGIRFHHERFDGKGYPDGLSDTDIPLIARILALADSFDAMTSNRVYRKRLSDEEVKNELLRCSGTQFDPALTGIFIKLLEKGELNANTAEGVSLDNKGNITVSAMLENRLQKDLLNKVEIINPSHIRMLCYMIKLMERKNEGYSVYIIRDKEFSDPDKGSTLIKECCGPHDLCLRYTEESAVLALYNTFGDEAKNKLELVLNKLPDPQYENIG